jgi:hypothetical protein
MAFPECLSFSESIKGACCVSGGDAIPTGPLLFRKWGGEVAMLIVVRKVKAD